MKHPRRVVAGSLAAYASGAVFVLLALPRIVH
jgi:hypothetical protein